MNMQAIKIDKNRDPILINGRIQMVYDIEVIKQNCECALRQLKGELIYFKNKGISYFDNLFTGSPNLTKFDAEARTNLLKLEGVKSITSFNYELTENGVTYELTITTKYGDLTINE